VLRQLIATECMMSCLGVAASPGTSPSPLEIPVDAEIKAGATSKLYKIVFDFSTTSVQKAPRSAVMRWRLHTARAAIL
jgi:hypothetical protein